MSDEGQELVNQEIDKTRIVAESHVLIAQQSTSLLPPADEMHKYEELYSGATKKFFDMMEKQQNHRIKIEEKVINHNCNQALIGQILGFVLSLICVCGGMFLLVKGVNLTGFMLVLSPLTALAGVFIYGKHQNKLERIEKAKHNPSFDDIDN